MTNPAQDLADTRAGGNGVDPERGVLHPAPGTYPPDAPVWLVLGPEAVDAGLALGLGAVVGVERPVAYAQSVEWVEEFRGRNVAIVSDCDALGRDAAEKAAAALARIATVRKPIDLDPGRDDGYNLVGWLEEAEGEDAPDGGVESARKALVTYRDSQRILKPEPESKIIFDSPESRVVDIGSRRNGDRLASAPDHFDGWPAPMREEAFHGVAGDFVKLFAPETEADPAALLGTFLVAMGNAIGRGPSLTIDGSRHGVNLFLVLIGPTSTGRKGTSLVHVRRLMQAIDPEWERTRVKYNVSSGEGIAWAVRDPIAKMVPDKNDPEQFNEITVDPGVADKRLLTVETEWSALLSKKGREGSTIDETHRQGWDGGRLGSLTKEAAYGTAEAHVSVIGHIPTETVRHGLKLADATSGFGNRYLFFATRRCNVLPLGGNAHKLDIAPLVKQAQAALDRAQRLPADLDLSTGLTPGARERWSDWYLEESERRGIGFTDALTARAAPQVARLALLYATLDCSPLITEEHIDAAIAVWDYAWESATHFFTRDQPSRAPDEARELLAAVRDVLPAAAHGGQRVHTVEILDRLKKHPRYSGEEWLSTQTAADTLASHLKRCGVHTPTQVRAWDTETQDPQKNRRGYRVASIEAAFTKHLGGFVTPPATPNVTGDPALPAACNGVTGDSARRLPSR